jgi:DNA-binding response OmpR family regulator
LVRAPGEAVTFLRADGARAGLKLALERRPRLAVVEADLPDGDAEGLVRALRRAAMPPPAPIVVLADEGTPRKRARFLWAGASAYVSGPVSSSQMDRMVGILIEVAARR